MKIQEINEGFWDTVGHGLATGAGLTNVAKAAQEKMSKNIKIAPIALSKLDQVSTYSDVDAEWAEKEKLAAAQKKKKVASTPPQPVANIPTTAPAPQTVPVDSSPEQQRIAKQKAAQKQINKSQGLPVTPRQTTAGQSAEQQRIAKQKAAQKQSDNTLGLPAANKPAQVQQPAQTGTSTPTTNTAIRNTPAKHVATIDHVTKGGKVKLYYNAKNDKWYQVPMANWGPDYAAHAQAVPTTFSDNIAKMISNNKSKFELIPGTKQTNQPRNAKRKYNR